MIGFSSLSSAAGMACVSLAAESQLNNPSTERQSRSNLPDAQSETSGRAKPSSALQALQAPVIRATGDSHLGHGQFEQTKQGILKVIARQFHEIAAELYRYVPGAGLK
jgi:hypothetical protein